MGLVGLPIFKGGSTKNFDRIFLEVGPAGFIPDFEGKSRAALGTRLHFSTAFHPQTDGQSKRTIQTMEDMLRSCAMQSKGSWDKNLSLIEFAYNNCFHSSIGMAPFEALYGRQCRTPLCWNEVGEKEFCGPEIIQDTNEKIKGVVHFGKRGKLSLRYISPYEIIERVGTVAYRLELPSELSRIHNVFHVSMLRKYIANPSHVLQEQPISLKKDLTIDTVNLLEQYGIASNTML
ncbi:hypothetical protein ACLB2K_072548 [Fragaria x ananassa]